MSQTECRRVKPRRLYRLAVRHDVLCGSPTYSTPWVQASSGRTLVAREGHRRGRSMGYLMKLAWSFDPLLGLTIGAAGHAREISHETVPVTFVGSKGKFSKLDLSLRLGKDLEMLRQYHEGADVVEQVTPPLPQVYAVLPEDEPDVGKLTVNKQFIDDQLMQIAQGTGALLMEQAPEDLFAAADGETYTIHVRYADGSTDAWPYPQGTQLLVPPEGCDVEAGQVIAHVIPRRGASAVRRLTPATYHAAERSVVDTFVENIDGNVGYDLRLFDGPLPKSTRAFVHRDQPLQDACLCTPVHMIGRIGLISYNMLSNWFDQRVPERAARPVRRHDTALTSPLMGAA